MNIHAMFITVVITSVNNRNNFNAFVAFITRAKKEFTVFIYQIWNC